MASPGPSTLPPPSSTQRCGRSSRAPCRCSPRSGWRGCAQLKVRVDLAGIAQVRHAPDDCESHADCDRGRRDPGRSTDEFHVRSPYVIALQGILDEAAADNAMLRAGVEKACKRTMKNHTHYSGTGTFTGEVRDLIQPPREAGSKRLSQAKNSRYHRRELCGLRIQWFSLGKCRKHAATMLYLRVF